MIPPAGPPITLPLGWLLPGGQVWRRNILNFFAHFPGEFFFAHVPGAIGGGDGG